MASGEAGETAPMRRMQGAPLGSEAPLEMEAQAVMRIAISGTRDISSIGISVVRNRMKEIMLECPEKLIFGGARGTDTVALMSAGDLRTSTGSPKFEVIVPRRLKDQPLEAQRVIRQYADEVFELGSPRLDASAYRRRNRELVSRADHLVAFWDGCSSGTGMTIAIAREIGISVEVIQVDGSSVVDGNKICP